MRHANIYKIVFYFRGDYRYFDFDSNMLANKVLHSVLGDSILDISVERDNILIKLLQWTWRDLL